MKTIVVLVDLTAGSGAILEQAKLLAKAFGSSITLMHVVPPRPTVVDIGLVSATLISEPTKEDWNADQKELLKLRDSLIAEGIPATAEQYQEASVDRVLSESGRLKADLIVMGSHHHSALYDLLVGSITHDVLKRATCPVLVVPAPVAG